MLQRRAQGGEAAADLGQVDRAIAEDQAGSGLGTEKVSAERVDLYEQGFSEDGGDTWETNWINKYTSIEGWRFAASP